MPGPPRDEERDRVLREIILNEPFLIISPALVMQAYKERTGEKPSHSTVSVTLGKLGPGWVRESPYHDACVEAFLKVYLTLRGTMGQRRTSGRNRAKEGRKDNGLNT